MGVRWQTWQPPTSSPTQHKYLFCFRQFQAATKLQDENMLSCNKYCCLVTRLWLWWGGPRSSNCAMSSVQYSYHSESYLRSPRHTLPLPLYLSTFSSVGPGCKLFNLPQPCKSPNNSPIPLSPPSPPPSPSHSLHHHHTALPASLGQTY